MPVGNGSVCDRERETAPEEAHDEKGNTTTDIEGSRSSTQVGGRERERERERVDKAPRKLMRGVVPLHRDGLGAKRRLWRGRLGLGGPGMRKNIRRGNSIFFMMKILL